MASSDSPVAPRNTRVIRLNFRVKNNARSAVKVFTTVRVRGRATPKQLHLGYIMVRHNYISEGARLRLMRRLREHWKELFGDDDVTVNWKIAEEKFAAKRLEWLSDLQRSEKVQR